MTKGIFERMGLVESDEPETPKPVVPPSIKAAVSLSAVPYSKPTLDAEDEARMKAIEAQVYATPSTYLIFRNVRETLGDSTDLASVFRVLAAANPGVTAAKIRGDIDTHLSVIESKRLAFDSQVAQTKATKIDATKQKIVDLQFANEQVKKQVAEREDLIKVLQQNVNETEKALADGQARFKLIEDQLSAPLNQAKQLLGGMQ